MDLNENAVDMTIAHRTAYRYNCAALAGFVGAHGLHSECYPQSIYERSNGVGVRGVQHIHAFDSCTGTGDTARCTHDITHRVHVDAFLFTDHRPQPGFSHVAPYGAHRTRASPQSPWSTAARSSDHAAIYHAPPPNSLY